MTLCHGSKSGIVGPIRPSSRSTCDFGRAFYMGESEYQPLTLICHSAQSKLYTLEFDDSGLRVLDVGSDFPWAMFGVYAGYHTLSPDEAVARLKEERQ